ncbi:dTDP-glucose 4,6-dehydratase [Ignavibacteria bacterium]|jgi:dTDP-glucose 4,6-dehydratase|nr:dTDP-glucose 4,6-dehydratase [Bacteroidota bacterium]MCZ2131729.1 dTDP-glucose 4,6-dehydratase [Bacteroidota bacterium]
MSETILLAGGAGFIGSNLADYLLAESDADIVILDALTYAGNLMNLRNIVNNTRLRFIHGHIENSEIVNHICTRYCISGIINAAAETHVDRSIHSAAPFVQANIVGTQVLLDAAVKYGLRFIQISTDEVYGSLGENGTFTESSPLRPSSPYSASKAAGDMLTLSFVATYGLRASITRCSNNYGAYQFPEKLIPLMICNALEDKPLPVYGNGNNVRDWIYARDHVRAIWAAYKFGEPGEVYNIGARCEMRNIDIVKMILAILDKPESLIKFTTDRPGHDFRYAIDPSYAEMRLGWKPQAVFADALKETVEWYINNDEWLTAARSGEYRNYYARQYGKSF